MFKKGDYIRYGFYDNLKVINKDDKHYLLKDPSGKTKKVYISLINEHAVLLDSPANTFLSEYEKLCLKHGVFINFLLKGAALEFNPNNKGNETVKEQAWTNFFKEHIKEFKNSQK